MTTVPGRLRCPHCAHPINAVMDSRGVVECDHIRRRRKCGRCGERFTTFETHEARYDDLVKREAEVARIANAVRELAK